MVDKSSRFFLVQVDVSYELLILSHLPQSNTKELWEPQFCPENWKVSLFIPVYTISESLGVILKTFYRNTLFN